MRERLEKLTEALQDFAASVIDAIDELNDSLYLVRAKCYLTIARKMLKINNKAVDHMLDVTREICETEERRRYGEMSDMREGV